MQIQYTHQYDRFGFLLENRKITEPTIKMLMNDPTFPDTFKYKPIIVNEDYKIIDGQHRFEAAKRLGIMIYYVIQKGATQENIIKYNVQNKIWSDEDYLETHRKKLKDEYILIENLMKNYGWKLKHVLQIIAFINQKNPQTILVSFRHGDLVIENKEFIEEFLAITTEGFEKLALAQPISEWRHLRRRVYIHAFVEIFLNDIYKYEKFMAKLSIIFNKLPETSIKRQALEWICKAMKWKDLEENPTNE